MINISKYFYIFLVIKSIDFVNSQFFNRNQQQFGGNSQCAADDYGNIGICKSATECRGVRNFDVLNLCRNSRFGPIVCCPLRGPNRRGGTERRGGGPNRRGGQRGGNGQRENIQALTLSQRKCQQLYTSNNRVKRAEETLYYPSIVGGKLTSAGEFPYMAAIGWENTAGAYDYNCGGFLVANNFVVTAAHCTTLRGVAPSVVKLGGGNLDNPGAAVDVPISRVIPHPRYNSGQSYNDIAVIQLVNNVVNTPACLWPVPNINYQIATAIGYGHTSFAGRRSSDLLKVDLNVFSNQACSQYYPPGSSQIENGLDQSQLCAGDPNRAKDTCQGDSGGPILVKATENGKTIPYIIGVTSFGQGCAGAAPSIYTRISSYTRWIESIVWPNES